MKPGKSMVLGILTQIAFVLLLAGAGFTVCLLFSLM